MTTPLDLRPVADHLDLVAPPVAAALAAWPPELVAEVLVAPIDPDLADTAAFCAEYGIGLDRSANCVVVAGRRGGEERYAACMVLATQRADVNGVVRRSLDVRKISFARQDDAVARSGMEYGGMTPLGLPADWPVLVDPAVAAAGRVVVGSGVRGSKLELPGTLLSRLPTASVLPGTALV